MRKRTVSAWSSAWWPSATVAAPRRAASAASASSRTRRAASCHEARSRRAAATSTRRPCQGSSSASRARSATSSPSARASGRRPWSTVATSSVSAEPRRQLPQRVQQRHRVGPARHRDQHDVAGGDERVRANRAEDRRQHRARAVYRVYRGRHDSVRGSHPRRVKVGRAEARQRRSRCRATGPSSGGAQAAPRRRPARRAPIPSAPSARCPATSSTTSSTSSACATPATSSSSRAPSRCRPCWTSRCGSATSSSPSAWASGWR